MVRPDLFVGGAAPARLAGDHQGRPYDVRFPSLATGRRPTMVRVAKIATAMPCQGEKKAIAKAIRDSKRVVEEIPLKSESMAPLPSPQRRTTSTCTPVQSAPCVGKKGAKRALNRFRIPSAISIPDARLRAADGLA